MKWAFMAVESFEEYALPAARVGNQAAFLLEGMESRGMFLDGICSSVDVPDVALLKVTFKDHS